MRSSLNKFDTNPEIQTPLSPKQNPRNNSFLIGIIVFISPQANIIVNFLRHDLHDLHDKT